MRIHPRVVIGVALMALVTGITPVPARAADPWSGPYVVADGETSQVGSYGRALGRTTTTSGVTTLHAVYHRFLESGADIEYRGSVDDGSTWSAPVRLSGVGRFGSEARIATSGSYVYAAWQGGVNGVTGSYLAFRRNTSHGDPGAWSGRIRLASSTRSITSVALAASGASVYVIYRDSGSKRVYLQISRNRGVTWARRAIASWDNVTTHAPINLRIAASGSTVGITWLNGGVRARVSTDGARTFAPSKVVSRDTARARADLAVLGTRIAVGWVDSLDRPRVRLWSAGVWQPARLVGVDPELVGAPATEAIPALRGTAEIGMLVAHETTASPSAYVLTWTTSADAGGTWLPSEQLPDHYGAGASLVWRSTGRVYAMYLGTVTSAPLPFAPLEMVRR